MRLDPESWFVQHVSLRHGASGRNGGSCKGLLWHQTKRCVLLGLVVRLRDCTAYHLDEDCIRPWSFWTVRKLETWANVDKESTLLFTCMGCLPAIKSTSRAMWHTQWKMGFTTRFHVSLQWDISHFCWVTKNKIGTYLKLKVIYLTWCKTRALPTILTLLTSEGQTFLWSWALCRVYYTRHYECYELSVIYAATRIHFDCKKFWYAYFYSRLKTLKVWSCCHSNSMRT